MEHHYRDTLIAVAEDCPTAHAVVPTPSRGGAPTVATVQYGLLAARPGALTQPDVLFETWLARRGSADPVPPEQQAALRTQLFAKPQACLRASPLPKRYGWGLLFDSDGRVTLCPMESDEYRRIAAGEVRGLTVRRAMRSRRG